ncbi:Tim44/TimA family putative adaptor protein [Rickettsiales bacterium]|nr:Tim44/TimA family putative adaptor protein [Rickettsiales bacterium]
MDIIFFAALTLYIFFKLKSQLGKVDEDQKREAIKKFLKQQADIVEENHTNKRSKTATQNSDRSNTKTPNLIVVDANDDSQENKSHLENIELINKVPVKNRENILKTLDSSKVTISEFVFGAEKAFEMVILAFCQNDLKTLEFLLDKKLYNKFVKAINNRENAGQKLVTNIISLDEIIILDAKLQENKAQISVEFKSKQISYVSDKDNKIIEGSSDEIINNDDIWILERNINSKNPNWTIISTKS